MKFGLLPRGHDPRIPHLSAYLGERKNLVAPPTSVDYTSGMPTDWGMMLNDSLGDCAEAAWYHARQVLSFNSRHVENTQPDGIVEKLYSEAAGYVPGDPNTDQGTVLQTLLQYVYNTGAPLANGKRDKILAFVEVDPRNLDDVMRTIADCGFAYVGIAVPQWLDDAINSGSAIPAVWSQVGPMSQDGHCIAFPGYDSTQDLWTFISWGTKYQMTTGLFSACVTECYGVVDKEWIEISGESPFGMTEAQLEQAMSALNTVLLK